MVVGENSDIALTKKGKTTTSAVLPLSIFAMVLCFIMCEVKRLSHGGVLGFKANTK
jgi:hypothetical protein